MEFLLEALKRVEEKYRLEKRANGAGSFLLCFVVDSEVKRFCIVFPEGRVIHGGWALLSEKLHSSGVGERIEDLMIEGPLIGGVSSRPRKEVAVIGHVKKSSCTNALGMTTDLGGDVVCLQLEENFPRLEKVSYHHCVVGR